MPTILQYIFQNWRPVLAQFRPASPFIHCLLEFSMGFDFCERFLEGTDFPKENAERVHVGGEAVASTQCNFWSHVSWRATSIVEQLIFSIPIVQANGEPKVEQLQHAHGIETYVGRFQIPEHDILRVQIRQCAGQGASSLDLTQRWHHGASSLCGFPCIDTIFKRILQSIDQDKVPITQSQPSCSAYAAASAAVQLNDIGMVQAGQHGRFVYKILNADYELFGVASYLRP
mmetsp:Transcript_21848/g.52825  ORF Transcript_21848/g.52825 Transcript_21848/m.52825 type:complete len:230 (-) Transcript_21848:10-699(-)